MYSTRITPQPISKHLVNFRQDVLPHRKPTSLLRFQHNNSPSQQLNLFTLSELEEKMNI